VHPLALLAAVCDSKWFDPHAVGMATLLLLLLLPAVCPVLLQACAREDAPAILQ
jgi:hypothetical protein